MIRKVIGENIMVQSISGEEVSPGGIIVPKKGQFANGTTGLVISVGSGRIDQNGKYVHIDCKPGDIILYRNFASADRRGNIAPDVQVVEWSEGGKTFRIIPEHYFIAVLQDNFNPAEVEDGVLVDDEPVEIKE